MAKVGKPPKDPDREPRKRKDRMVPVTDPLLVPFDVQSVDEGGNVVVTGFPPGSATEYEGTPLITADQPGLGPAPE